MQVSASDSDCGSNGGIRYSFADDLGFKIPQEMEVDQNTGEVCIAETLDYEDTSSYEFPIVATDQG